MLSHLTRADSQSGGQERHGYGQYVFILCFFFLFKHKYILYLQHMQCSTLWLKFSPNLYEGVCFQQGDKSVAEFVFMCRRHGKFS